MKIIYRGIYLNILMAQRITIMIDDAVIKKVRKLQAREIVRQGKSVSLSSVINVSLKESFT